MTTRIVYRGRLVYTNGRLSVPTPHNESSCHAIEPDGDALPLREGPVWEDPDDGMSYRWVRAGLLRVEDGWLTVGAWIKRLGCGMPQLRAMVAAGLFDAAVERGSAHRCLRALDMLRVEATVQLNRRKPGRPRKVWA